MPTPAKPANKVDLELLAKQAHYEIKSHELPEELESRLRKEEADAALTRQKDFLLFVAAVLGVGGIAVLCIIVAIRPSGSADDKKWATAVLTSVVSAAVGFLAGKNSK